MRFLFCCAILTLAAFSLGQRADARCARSNYKIFLRAYESAKVLLIRKPARAYDAFVALRRRAQACGAGEDRSDVRYKLLLFETGLLGYIGAADALRGNSAQGRATAEEAMAKAVAIEQKHRANAADLRLAQELVAQLKFPLRMAGVPQGP